MAKFLLFLPLIAFVLPVRPCIPTQGPDDDEFWNELSPTTSLLLQYSTLPADQTTLSAAQTSSTSPATTSTASTTTTTVTSTTTSTSTTTTTTAAFGTGKLLKYMTSAECTDGTWIYNAATGRCYKAIVIPAAWQAAEDNCITLGGHLVSIGDATEQTYVYNTVIVPSASPSDPWYIGLSQGADSTELMDMSEWTDDTPYDFAGWTNWVAGPPGFLPSTSCITMHVLTGDGTEGQWDFQMCNLPLQYVCEMAAMPTG